MVTRPTVLGVVVFGVACGAPRPCPFETCDLRQSECQRQLIEVAACLRQREPISVDVNIRSRDEATSELVRNAQESADGGTTFADVNTGLALLKMAEAETSLEQAATELAKNVAAFYRSDTKSITIIGSDEPLNSPNSNFIFIHEAAHALQNSMVDLKLLHTTYGTTTDRALSVRALTEGEATFVEDRATLSYYGISEGHSKWEEVFRNWERYARYRNEESSMPLYVARQFFPYPHGTHRVHTTWSEGGWEAVDALYQAPVLSTREWMFSPEEIASSGGAGRESLQEDAVPVVGPDFKLIESDELGAWLFHVFLERNAKLTDSLPVALTLRGDVLSIQGNETGDIVIAWRLRLSEEKVAIDLVSELTKSSQLKVWKDERDVVVMASTNAELQASFGPSLIFAPKP